MPEDEPRTQLELALQRIEDEGSAVCTEGNCFNSAF